MQAEKKQKCRKMTCFSQKTNVKEELVSKQNIVSTDADDHSLFLSHTQQ